MKVILIALLFIWNTNNFIVQIIGVLYLINLPKCKIKNQKMKKFFRIFTLVQVIYQGYQMYKEKKNNQSIGDRYNRRNKEIKSN